MRLGGRFIRAKDHALDRGEHAAILFRLCGCVFVGSGWRGCVFFCPGRCGSVIFGASRRRIMGRRAFAMRLGSRFIRAKDHALDRGKHAAILFRLCGCVFVGSGWRGCVFFCPGRCGSVIFGASRRRIMARGALAMRLGSRFIRAKDHALDRGEHATTGFRLRGRFTMCPFGRCLAVRVFASSFAVRLFGRLFAMAAFRSIAVFTGRLVTGCDLFVSGHALVAGFRSRLADFHDHLRTVGFVVHFRQRCLDRLQRHHDFLAVEQAGHVRIRLIVLGNEGGRHAGDLLRLRRKQNLRPDRRTAKPRAILRAGMIENDHLVEIGLFLLCQNARYPQRRANTLDAANAFGFHIFADPALSVASQFQGLDCRAGLARKGGFSGGFRIDRLMGDIKGKCPRRPAKQKHTRKDEHHFFGKAHLEDLRLHTRCSAIGSAPIHNLGGKPTASTFRKV